MTLPLASLQARVESVKEGRRRPDTKCVVLAVSVDLSLDLLRGYPSHLADIGWDVHVVSSPGPRLAAYTELRGITAHPLPMRREPSPLADLVALVRWVRLLRQLRPDAVFVGTPKAGLLGTLAATITGVPRRVYVLRGLRLETAQGAKRRILLCAERLTAGCAHTVFAVSPSLRRRALQLSIGNPDKVQVIGRGSSNGVDTGRFDRERFGPDLSSKFALQVGLWPNVPVIGFVGRLTPDKGLHDLAAAYRLLIARDIDFQLLVVGALDGGADILQQFRDQGRPVIETGHVQDTSPYYPLMDILVLPTLREGFPNVVLEASASGVPVITTDATGAIDSVVDGQTGYVVPINDPNALANAIAQTLGDPAGRRRLGAQGRAFTVSNFEQEQFWPTLDSLLERATRL